MNRCVSRREFVALVPGACSAAALLALGPRAAIADDAEVPAAPTRSSPVPSEFPRQRHDQVKELVTVAHFDIERVRTLVSERPALAKATWDWGFGDWETAVDAASHMGRRDIVAVLVEHGARPTLFTLAMLGQRSAVRAVVEAQPAWIETPGPHGISLLAQAVAGGAAAREVVSDLESRGASLDLNPGLAVPSQERRAIQGTYAYGTAEDERLEVAERRGNLEIRRAGDTPRELIRVGAWEYHPVGAPGVRIRFDAKDGLARALTVADAELKVAARRVP